MTTQWIRWLFGVFILAQAAWAHDVWLVDKDNHLELLYGHEIPEVYNPAKVVEYKGYDMKGQPVALKTVPLPEVFAIIPNPKAVAITVVFDNGYWIAVSSTSEWQNVSLETAGRFPKYHNPVKFHKSLYAWSDRFARPLGLRFEIVPLTNPFVLKQGQVLPVQVLVDGKPFASADVEYGFHGDKALKVQADDQGRASVPILTSGEQFIAVDNKIPSASPAEKQMTSLATSLRFELK